MASEQTTRSERRDDARRWLSRFGCCVSANMRALELVTQLEGVMTSVTQRWEECSTSSAGEAMSGQIARLEELCEQLRDTSEMYGEYLDEIAEVIYMVGEVNSNAGSVLAKRYMVLGKPQELEEIANSMNYSPEWVRHLHIEGLDIVADILERRKQ